MLVFCGSICEIEQQLHPCSLVGFLRKGFALMIRQAELWYYGSGWALLVMFVKASAVSWLLLGQSIAGSKPPGILLSLPLSAWQLHLDHVLFTQVMADIRRKHFV